MADVIKFDPKLNRAVKSTELNPSVKALKANIATAINAIDFNPSISRQSPNQASKTELISKEKHNYIVSRILSATMDAVETFDASTKAKSLTGSN
jgi:hypothetical protein